MSASNGKITTHVLDVSLGKPVGGMAIELWRIAENEAPQLAVVSETNSDGRLDAPLLQGQRIQGGVYEIVFAAGDYLLRGDHPFAVKGRRPLFDRIPIRFYVHDVQEHYHIPLLVAPGGYSTYRGS
ncbi:hydroxyisourate hydrolase [Paenibacillus radicis (ex Gao et al. 2016)]|uniref:5-hydroxyisourate hydrolase n=1 Tax=Paenibacillus radicis (ex Gao et al. 2016) TaxID=1737354 RepID=A0A917HHP0_9BACL|nr:hydroxyisourate hydrolase [Paenibacillus radicis (ex Gao et al. 2016)]GGG79651.1 5-hydroxyisourate hydrolase 1 [Paenibacillus radicis (ex Gao et al. 2016)]